MRNRIPSKKKQNRFATARLVLLVAFFLLCLLLIFGSTVGGKFGVFHQITLEGLGPIQGVFSSVAGSIKSFREKYIVKLDVEEDNRRLRQSLAKTQIQLDQYREAYALNRYLQNELDFKKEEKFPSLSARVIGKDPSFWFHTLIVDRGKNDGVVESMVARTSQGVAGQVVQVSDNYAKILLANAPSSAIDAMVQKNRVRGILKGHGDKGYVLNYVLKKADVAEGDVIVTAGIGGVFPTGIPLGTVSSVRTKRRGMFLEIEVIPAVDFESLEFLFINLSERQKIAEEMEETRRAGEL